MSESQEQGGAAVREHRYTPSVRWTGNTGTGTSSYRGYKRDHDIFSEGKATILGSSDPAFRGDRTRWSPEDLLVAALSTCHQLWYLHLCADAGIVVTAYEDTPEGFMAEHKDGSGEFARVVLRPRVTLAPGANAQLAQSLHARAHELCFIARSVKCAVTCEPRITVAT